jgi:eukaryotic-like serine/threonine-protein kinase
LEVGIVMHRAREVAVTVARADVAVAPGMRIDQRYRLNGLLALGAGCSLWRGTDELLKRHVAVHVFDSDFARSSGVFDAVRCASQLTHGGLAQVFDANESADPPYLVREWIGGRDLGSALVDGPLDPRCAAEIFWQASEAIAVAHAAGVYHLRLSPRSVRWSKAGRVKVVGVGIDAALTGTRVPEPQLVDAQALAKLLRIALSGRWPYQGAAIYPTSSQGMRAWVERHQGIGRELASIVRRTLHDGRRPIRSPGQLADELRRVALRGKPAARRPDLGAADPAVARRRARAGALAASTKPLRPLGVPRGHRGAAA